jgi:aspartate aminotransferase
MQEEGINVINFTVGEPDFNTPDYIIEAAKKALDEGRTKYTASAGILPLRKAI